MANETIDYLQIDYTKKEVIHCPQCHEDVVPQMWICGCWRCPTQKCMFCFKSCGPVMFFNSEDKRPLRHCNKCNKDYRKPAGFDDVIYSSHPAFF